MREWSPPDNCAPPLVNASRPQGEWNVYDIFFEAPLFDGDKLAKPGYVTVSYGAKRSRQPAVPVTLASGQRLSMTLRMMRDSNLARGRAGGAGWRGGL